MATRLQCLKFHGLGVDAFDRQIQGSKPQAEFVNHGFKYNLPDINAVIAVVQLTKLKQINKLCAELVAYYRQALANLSLKMLDVPDYPHLQANHLFMVQIDKAVCGIDLDSFIERLQEKNIDTGLHFLAAHTQKYYREHYTSLSLPNSKWNSKTLCSLQLFPDMRAQDVDRVVAAINEIFWSLDSVFSK